MRPTRSGLPSTRSSRLTPSRRARAARARSITRGKSRSKRMRRGVRALLVAQLALEAEVLDPLDLVRAQLRDVAVAGLGVEGVEQRGERRAEVEAEPAAVADVEDPLLLGTDLAEVVEARLSRIEEGHGGMGWRPPRRCTRRLPPGQLDLSSPLVKRPACDFSARASVSNHSAISSKPSSRAVLAKPGYIWVYS